MIQLAQRWAHGQVIAFSNICIVDIDALAVASSYCQIVGGDTLQPEAAVTSLPIAVGELAQDCSTKLVRVVMNPNEGQSLPLNIRNFLVSVSTSGKSRATDFRHFESEFIGRTTVSYQVRSIALKVHRAFKSSIQHQNSAISAAITGGKSLEPVIDREFISKSNPQLVSKAVQSPAGNSLEFGN